MDDYLIVIVIYIWTLWVGIVCNFAPKIPRKLIIVHGLLETFLDFYGWPRNNI